MAKNYYLLFYEVKKDYLEQRAKYRKEHLLLTHQYAERGELQLGGAMEDPVDGAVLVFYVSDPKVIDDFVGQDPYVKAGLVSKWKIRKYNVVTGNACKNPLDISRL